MTVEAMMQQIQTLQPEELVELAKKILQTTSAQGKGAGAAVEVSAKLGYGRFEKRNGDHGDQVISDK